jgi:arginyl-tRNA synthetase
MGHAWAKRCEHIPFGLVQIGGKKGSTKEGNVVLLKEVIEEAENRVVQKLKDRVAVAAGGGVKNGELATAAELVEAPPATDDHDLARIASSVGRGAVVFANLVAQRDKDVAFEWDRVIALEGDSGVYLQYSHARCASIIRKAGGEWEAAINAHSAAARLGSSALLELQPLVAGFDPKLLSTDAEWAVARKLLDFPQAVVAATPKCEPHIICHYLLDLAGEFSRWYSAGNADHLLRVLCDDIPTRDARLALVAAVKTVLAEGLGLLGITAPDAM